MVGFDHFDFSLCTNMTFRLFDERKPLEPKYPSVNASDAERHYESIGSTNNTRYDPEIVRLLHAPPG